MSNYIKRVSEKGARQGVRIRKEGEAGIGGGGGGEGGEGGGEQKRRRCRSRR